MGSRVPVEHYNLTPAVANSYIGTSLHDPNSGDDPAAKAAADDNDDRSSAVGCIHEPYQGSLPLENMGMEDDRSSLENNGSSSCPYSHLTIDDVSPIETARARFLDIIVNHFIDSHVIEMSDYDSDYVLQQPSQDNNLSKRKSREVRYEGDARYVLPLMYIANIYETLVNEVSIRLSSLSGIREKTIGVALEAAGGLYRKLAKKFPRKGLFAFRRRELATSFETRSRFPELVIQEEKRVRFVVVNGLSVVEKPSQIGLDDAEWFKRVTGRNEVAISARDYKFYAPRHKYRRPVTNSISNVPSSLAGLSSPENSSSVATSQGYRPSRESAADQTPPKQQMQPPQFQHHHIVQPPHSSHHFMQTHHHQLPEIPSSSMSQHIACLQSLGHHHVGGRLHVMPTSPAKFCDQCGAPYVRDTSKFCSECGSKRLGL
ncbi:hypothetical protein M569_12454, partial [Genlisea aurea]